MSITDKRLTEIQARIEAATHEFLPVNGHPDDDECTNRADGTDDTYCGEPEAAHDVIPDEVSRDLVDLLAEVHRLKRRVGLLQWENHKLSEALTTSWHREDAARLSPTKMDWQIKED